MANIYARLQHDLQKERNKLMAAEEALVQAKQAVEKTQYKIDYIYSLLSVEEDSAPSSDDETSPIETESGPEDSSQGSATSDWMRKVMLDLRPMGASEIADRIIQEGVCPPNTSPVKLLANVTSMLARAVKKPEGAKFRKVGRGQYVLRAAPADHNGVIR